MGQAFPDDKKAPKPVFAALMKDQSIETITLEEALKLFDLPRKVGEFENEEITAAIGRFGPFIRHNNKFVTIPKELNPYTIKLDEAIELIEKKRIQEEQRFIKSFEEEPELQILNGRFGAYIAYKKSNYKIPKDTDPQKLTYDECMKIIEEAPDKKTTKKKATRKKE